MLVRTYWATARKDVTRSAFHFRTTSSAAGTPELLTTCASRTLPDPSKDIAMDRWVSPLFSRSPTDCGKTGKTSGHKLLRKFFSWFLVRYLALLTASPVGNCSPVIKLALIASPVVASYLPTVPLWFATKRVSSNNASAVGRPAPVMKLALIASPVEASYLPTVLEPKFATKRVLLWAASPLGALNCVIKLALIATPVVALYSRTEPVASNTKSLLPDNASALGKPAVMKSALIASPVEASYLPTVPKPKFATKRMLPRTASPWGKKCIPVMKLGLIAAPVAASYFPTEPLSFATKRVLPWTASRLGVLNRVIKLALNAAPVVALYSLTVKIPSWLT